MRHLPSVSALTAFEAAARRLSFKQAAEDLNLTPGAISRQVQALEAQLGAPLFVRGRRQVELTQTGRDYLADIAPALAALRAAGERAAASVVAPVVSIVAYPTFAVRWLIPRWGRLLDAHPDVDLRLTTTLNPLDFSRGDADFAIRVADARDAAASGPHWKLFEVDLFPVAAPDVARRIDGLGGLARETLLHAAPRPDDWPRWLEAAGAGEADAHRSLRFESLNLAIQAAIEGIGLAIAFDPIVADDLETGRLVRPFDVARRSSRALYLFETPSRSQTAARDAVRDWLTREAARLSPTPTPR